MFKMNLFFGSLLVLLNILLFKGCKENKPDNTELILKATQDAQMNVRLYSTALYPLTGSKEFEPVFRQAEKLDHFIRNFDKDEGQKLVSDYKSILKKSEAIVHNSFPYKPIPYNNELINTIDSVSNTTDTATLKALLRLNNIMIFTGWQSMALAKYPFTDQFKPIVKAEGDSVKITPLFLDGLHFNFLIVNNDTLSFSPDSIYMSKREFDDLDSLKFMYVGMNFQPQVHDIK